MEMDGKRRDEFDIIDHFIVNHAINLEAAGRTMSTPSEQMARMLVDINVSRLEALEWFSGCTPAKLVDVIRHMNVLEMMMGLAKMRARRTPANQAHVTNRKEHPALLAADAAEAALRGFAEIETTVGVARYAPLNALAILVGAQTGRGGVLTQCAVEEAVNLRLGFKGLTSYSETLSVYGSEKTFLEGDDTPWSKAFLASAYASRGVKTRFTSGTGAAALMGHSEGKSMLYLEARCLLVTRGAGSQGTQNGSISCIALPESLPNGVRAVLAENLIATLLGLEVAAGNDALASHSEMRKSAKLIDSSPGRIYYLRYGAIPRYDNISAAVILMSLSWMTLCFAARYLVDKLFTRSSRPKVRERAARVIRPSSTLDFPPISEEKFRRLSCYSSEDMPSATMDISATNLLRSYAVVDVIS
jgi:glycerol dehydratase large subunit